MVPKNMFFTTGVGVPFDPDEAWDERREEWLLSGHIVNSENHTIVTEAPEEGVWVTALAAAVFCC